MGARSDDKPFEHEAVVDPSLCVSCGICTGSCPTSTPFRRASALIPGIDLGWLPLAEVRSRTRKTAEALTGDRRVLIFGCDHSNRVSKMASDSIGAVSLPCTGMLPPSFIDFVLSRKLADGVVVTGCRDGECNYRLGPRWTEQRLNGERDPRLRERVPRERILRVWTAPTDWRALEREVREFQARLAAGDDAAPPPESEAAKVEAAE
jgi:coenzyme F420-reducing hydrogenase delta subunit